MGWNKFANSGLGGCAGMLLAVVVMGTFWAVGFSMTEMHPLHIKYKPGTNIVYHYTTNHRDLGR